MQEVEERLIIEANIVCNQLGDVNNSFSKILSAAQDYKDMGLTPIYLFDEEKMTIQVKIKETYEKKLN